MKLCHFEAGLDQPLFLISGPCVIESEQLAMDTAGQLKEMCAALNIPFIYKSSFDKANRSSTRPSADRAGRGLRILSEVKKQIGVPVLTDVHEDTPLDEVAAVVDVLQTPAFLCRQTNFIQNVARTGARSTSRRASSWRRGTCRTWSTRRVTGNEQIMVCERGVSFGYNTLVSDMRGLAIMRGAPVARWCSTPPIRCSSRAGRARPAAASASSCRCWRARRWPGVAGVFAETHPNPESRCPTAPMRGRSA
jgi:2-dehydro-3-deoxyphosphooctonate aldolase (KDO 8-P synthase)